MDHHSSTQNLSLAESLRPKPFLGLQGLCGVASASQVSPTTASLGSTKRSSLLFLRGARCLLSFQPVLTCHLLKHSNTPTPPFKTAPYLLPSFLFLLSNRHVCSVLSVCDPMHIARQAPLSMGFSRQEYWSRVPFPPPGDLPSPGIEPTSPSLAGRFFTTVPPGKPSTVITTF